MVRAISKITGFFSGVRACRLATVWCRLGLLAPVTLWMVAGLSLSPVSAADDYYYTILVGAYGESIEAEDIFVDLLDKHPPGRLDYLRVELVSGKYTVRVGRFAKKSEAEDLLKELAGGYSGASILQAPIDEKRITRIHRQEAGSPTASTADSEDDGAGPASPEERRVVSSSRRPGSGVHLDKELDLVGPHVVTPVKMLEYDDSGTPLRFPGKVFFDSIMNEIYVVASGGRIIIYGPDFFPDYSIGEGRGLESVTDLVVDEGGRLFITQLASKGERGAATARLTVLNAAFFPEFEVYLNNIEGVEGFIPQRLAIGIDGSIYIVGQGRRGFLVLDQNGRFLRWFKPDDAELYSRMAARQSLETEDLGIVQATDIAVDRRGRLFFASEESGRIYAYNSREKFLFSFGIQGGSSGKLSRPRGLAFDEEKRQVFVADFMRHTILVYDMDTGEYLFEFSGRGWSPGWLNYPGDIAVGHKNQVIIADRFNHRVQVLEVQ